MVTSTLWPPWMGAQSSISGNPLATSAADMSRSATRRFLPSPTLGTKRFWMMTSLAMGAPPRGDGWLEPGSDRQRTGAHGARSRADRRDGRPSDLLASAHDRAP